MNTNHLHSYIVTVEAGSITKAAAQLYITAPSLYQQLTLLENEVGCKLLNRNNKGVRPTAAGESFYKSAKHMVQYLDKAIHEAQSFDDRNSILRVGYFDTDDLYRIEAFMEEYPSARIQLRKMVWDGMDRLYSMLSDGIIDMTFSERTSSAEEKGFTFIPLRKDYISVMMSPSHPLSSKKQLFKKDLEGMTLYINSLDSPVAEQIMQMDLPVTFTPVPEERVEAITTLCYQGNLFVGENSYLKKEFSLKVRPLMPKGYVEYGVLYMSKKSHAVLNKYLAFIREN